MDGRPAWISSLEASADVDVTTFATIGMAASPMSGADHRAELHFSIRCHADSTSVGEISMFLANLAIHPFLNATFFDWWHKVRDPGPIPLFESATAVLFHPRILEAGWDTIGLDGTSVKILDVVPITPDEYRCTRSRICSIIGPTSELICLYRDKPSAAPMPLR